MASEFDLITAARTHQEDLLAEVRIRRQLTVRTSSGQEPSQAGRRIHALLRRLAGAPTFA